MRGAHGPCSERENDKWHFTGKDVPSFASGLDCGLPLRELGLGWGLYDRSRNAMESWHTDGSAGGMIVPFFDARQASRFAGAHRTQSLGFETFRFFQDTAIPDQQAILLLKLIISKKYIKSN